MEDKAQSEPATKGDLTKLETKVSTLTETTTRLALELSKTQTDVRQIKDYIATKLATKDDVNRIMGAIDAFAAEALAYRNHDTLRGGKIMEHETKLKNHDDRLVLLENPK